MPTAEKLSRRPAIKGGFKVLIVPAKDVRTTGGLTVPTYLQPTSGEGRFRVVGKAERGDVGCNSWAFDSKSRPEVVAQLRELADWIEKNAIED